jgi:hypothetical protein
MRNENILSYSDAAVFLKKYCFQQCTSIRRLIWWLGCYLVLTIIRKIPAPMTATPRAVNMPENCMMPSGRRLVDWKANSAPTMISVKPSSFSIIVNPMGLSSLMPEPSRLKFTVPRLILIYLS